MSVNPEFLDTLDVDVPNESTSSDSVESGSNTGNADSNDRKTEGSNAGSGADGKGIDTNTKDKLDPAKPDAAVEKVVPLRALQEERENAKQLKARIAELESEPKLDAEDKRLLAELKAQRAAAAAPKEVDFLDDPKGYVDAKVQKALDQLKAVDTKAETVNTQVTQQQQFAALQNAIVVSEAAFVKDNPDYLDALNHVRTVRANQIRLMDPAITEQQIGQIINNEELGAAAQLLRRGSDPCKFAYEYAKTLGYTKKELAAAAKVAADTSAARTMGSGGGDNASDALDDEDPNNEFLAVRNAFGKRK